MAEIINLRQARKARKRQDAERVASENRARFGRTAAEKARDALAAVQLATQLDGARRETAEGDNAE